MVDDEFTTEGTIGGGVRDVLQFEQVTGRLGWGGEEVWEEDAAAGGAVELGFL